VTRAREAPRAARTASSRRRLVARATRRFDAFAQAMSHTSATEASARPLIVPTSPTTWALRVHHRPGGLLVLVRGLPYGEQAPVHQAELIGGGRAVVQAAQTARGR